MAYVSGSFTATGTSDEISLGAQGVIGLRGTWSATIKLQVKGEDGEWYDVETFTANAALSIKTRGVYRLNCSAYTSGTAYYVIQS